MAAAAVVGNLRVTGNEIQYRVGGTVQDASLTFESGGITTAGYLKADYFEGTFKTGEVQDFVGSAITLTKSNALKSTYGGQVAVVGDNEIAVLADINVETTARSTADNSLQTRLSTEEVARSTNDGSLQTRLSTEEVARSTNDSSLETRLSTEEVNRSADDSSLETRLSTEEVNRSSADDSLQTRFSSADSSIETRFSTADNSLETRLSTQEQLFSDTFDGTITQTTLRLTADCEAQSFTTTSDARLKKDVEPVVGAVEMVSRINPVFYNWVDDRATINPGHKEIGFLAQELEAVLPHVVKTLDEGGELHGMKRVAYDRLVSLLCAAVKELKAEVDALKHA